MKRLLSFRWWYRWGILWLAGLFVGISLLHWNSPEDHLFTRLPRRIKGVWEYQHMDGQAAQAATQALAPGSAAPEFTLSTPLGQPLSLSQFRGKPVVLMFWASWCPSCRKENRELKEIYPQLQQAGIEIVAISLDREADAWQRAITKDGITWPQASDLKGVESPVALQYGVDATPTLWLIDGQGQVVGKNISPQRLVHPAQ